MDKSIALTQEVASNLVYAGAVTAVVCACFYVICVIIITETNPGRHIYNGVSSLWSKVRRRLHG